MDAATSPWEEMAPEIEALLGEDPPKNKWECAGRWEEAKTRSQVLHEDRPEDSKALAGLLVCKQLARARKMLEHLRKPYAGVSADGGTKQEWIRALKLEAAFDRQPAGKSEWKRALLALTLHLADANAEALARRHFGEGGETHTRGQKRFMVSHGYERDGQWIQINEEGLDAAQGMTEKRLSPKERDIIAFWKETHAG
jgi:hypothetical protein